MITKEKPKLNNISLEDNIEKLNKYNKKTNKLIYAILLVVAFLCLIVTYILINSGMIIYNPFETQIISVTSEEKNWYENTNINLFKNVNEKGEKIILPGDSGEYNFVLQNKGTQPTYCILNIKDKNKDNINIQYRLKMNNVYVIGDENTWVKAEQVNLENIYLSKGSKTLYSLEWKWLDSENDSKLVEEGLATYTVYIEIQSGTGR